MKLAPTVAALAIALALFVVVFEAAATDPIFVKWLVIDDPGDETIRLYWQRAEAGELSAEQLVDLGTMLFYRGWPGDAKRYLKKALDLDPKLSDAWFRIGLVKHHGGDLAGARSAYKKCLKLQSGHAWGNFYLGLLEEQTGEARSAMEHYERAFKHAPELADPRINPEILSSKLQVGALVQHFDRERFKRSLPMPVLDTEALRDARRQVKRETAARPTPTPSAAAASPAEQSESRSTHSAAGVVTTTGAVRGAGRGGGGTASRPVSREAAGDVPEQKSYPYGFPTPAPNASGSRSGAGGVAPRIGETSPDARLEIRWPALDRLAEILI